MRRRGTALRTALTLASLLLAACDSGPEGPGTILLRVGGPDLGGVLLEVEGVGIESFSGRGTTQVYSAAVSGSTTRHRVLLIQATGGELAVDVTVSDLGMEGPVVTVIQVTRQDNSMVPASGVTIGVERQ
jgi:hypothetical protein